MSFKFENQNVSDEALQEAKLLAFEEMNTASQKAEEAARLQALKEAEARLQAEEAARLQAEEAARLQALKEAEAAARLRQEAEAAAVPRGLYRFPLVSIPTNDSRWVSSVVYKINTHGWTIINDKDGNPRYYIVPDGNRACIFSSVIGGLTSINEPVIVKMLSDKVDKFVAEFNTKIAGEELNNYIRQFQYETVSKIAEMIIPELIYLIEYYLGLLKWHEDNPAQSKKDKEAARKDIEDINKMLYDLYNYSQEIINRPENFMVGVVYNAGEPIKEKAYQTDTTLLKAGINEEDWNTQEIFGPKVLSSTLKPVETDRDESTNTTYIFPKDSKKNPVFGNMTSKGKTKTFDATTSQMLMHAFSQAPLALVFDNSCFEILSSDRRLIQNFDIIEDLRKEIASLKNRIQMTREQSHEIQVKIRKITGISRDIGGKQDDSLTSTTLLDQLAKLQQNSAFMGYYQDVTTKQAVVDTKPKKKNGGKRKTLKKYRKKMSQKKRHLSKNKRRKTKRK
jgi:hypothetical protein